MTTKRMNSEWQQDTAQLSPDAGRTKPHASRLVSPRFVRGRSASVALNAAQKRHVDEVSARIADGRYRLLHEACACGEGDGTVVARVDRYGLPLDTVLCQKCGTLRFDPYLSTEDLSDFYVKFYQEMYARVTDPDTYFKRQQSYGRRLLNFAQKVLPEHARIVEVGCGAGGALAVFQDAGFHVMGCDFSQPLLDMGRQRGVGDLHFGGIEALVDQCQDGQKADLIFLHHVFEHVSSPGQVLETAKRMLSERGLVIVAVPDVTRIDQFPFPSGNLRLFLHIAHKFNFTVGGLAGLGRRAGLHATAIPMEMSSQAPEIWVAFSRQPLQTAAAAPTAPVDGDSMFRLLRRIEWRFVRNALLGKLGGPFRRQARPPARIDETVES